MAGLEWHTQTHGTVQPGIGAEETEISGIEGEVGHCQGFQRLWAPPGDGDLLQIPGGGGVLDNVVSNQAVAEHGCTVHRYTITVRPV